MIMPRWRSAVAAKGASQLFVLVTLGDSWPPVYRLPVQWLEMLEISKKHCVPGSLSLNYGLFAEPPERRASVVRVAETRARETIHIYVDTQVSARIVRTDCKSTDGHQTTSRFHYLPHCSGASPYTVITPDSLHGKCKNGIVSKTFLPARYRHWAAEYLRLYCVQRLQSARIFADRHSLLFCGISFHGWLCPYIFARTAK